ncbi:hypothetical protein CERZMDRAFT_93003 [Cercospora zeae-maydis SCOH1-5]|uniref:Uncharacterized protein n=1 Tax=Cercospora zeae-maydis SCOH1-5 TaxID=717836 RepID=A0A6A6FTW6_9PEZI|nr:hypothetical protein CERZMDRAFT_93003 [Cercospora zeae-maydis SCOH1-5]
MNAADPVAGVPLGQKAYYFATLRLAFAPMYIVCLLRPLAHPRETSHLFLCFPFSTAASLALVCIAIPPIAMAGSKFTEILDTNAAPYSRDNVTLDDVLAETRQRSESRGSIASSSSDKSSSGSSPTSSSYNFSMDPVKKGFRRFSIMNKR